MVHPEVKEIVDSHPVLDLLLENWAVDGFNA